MNGRLADKLAVVKSENKLQQLGFVYNLDNVSEENKALIVGKLQNYIPWRAAWNEQSKCTTCRLVFASLITSTGVSLNELIAKGVNSMNKLIVILGR